MQRGAPTKLNPDLATQISFAFELGLSAKAVAAHVGIGERTLRRWLARGRRELEALSVEAQLALDVDRAAKRAEALRWQDVAAKLEANATSWQPFVLDDDVTGPLTR
jgi:hypothetical protein